MDKKEEEKLIKRINELTKISRERELTPDEVVPSTTATSGIWANSLLSQFY